MQEFFYYQGNLTSSYPEALHTSRAFCYGESIFTTFAIEEQKILLGFAHFHRLFRGVEDYYLGRSLSNEEKHELMGNWQQLLAALGQCKGAVRLSGSIIQKERSPKRPSKLGLNDLCWSLSLSDFKTTKDITNAYLVSSLCSFPSEYKIGASYAHSFYQLAQLPSQADEAILVSGSNQVLSATSANIYIVAGEKIMTPVLKEGVLRGALRKELVRDFDIDECEIDVKELFKADEVFVSNSVKGIQAVEVVLNQQRKKRYSNNHVLPRIQLWWQENRKGFFQDVEEIRSQLSLL